MPNLSKPEWKYSWVYEQWKNNNYKVVQEAFDRPYDELPAPSKIPAGAIEFDVSGFGETESVTLDIGKAICEVIWKNGVKLQTFVDATQLSGWYRFENLPAGLNPSLIAPSYNKRGENKSDEMSFIDLERLGYNQGKVSETNNSKSYIQDGWGGFTYKIFLEWENINKTQTGCWSISSSFPGWHKKLDASELVTLLLKKGFQESGEAHTRWWENFWAASSISIPDTILECTSSDQLPEATAHQSLFRQSGRQIMASFLPGKGIFIMILIHN
jgi:alpha-L-fucosidase 2